MREFIPVKLPVHQLASVGEVIDYTVTLTNTCSNPIDRRIFRDAVPAGLVSLSGSVLVNGNQVQTANPNTGFTLPDIPGGGMATVRFSVLAESVLAQNPTVNNAGISYSYTPVEGESPENLK